MLPVSERTGMILAAEYTPSPLRLMLGRHSGIGNRIPRFPIFFRESGRDAPIPDLAGKQGIPDSRFGREPGIGVLIRRTGDFLVWQTGAVSTGAWTRRT
jgi:hypothetical protein